MRSVVVASLLLVPLATALSSHASESPKNVLSKVKSPQVSTGIQDPSLLRTPKTIAIPYHDLLTMYPQRRDTVDLMMTVEANGRAHNIHVIKTTDPFLDNSAIAKAEQLQWKPASLDHKSVNVPVRLDMVISRKVND